MKGESADARYHHDDGSHAHGEALDEAGPLQHLSFFWSYLCKGTTIKKKKNRAKKNKKRKKIIEGFSLAQWVLQRNNEQHHKSF